MGTVRAWLRDDVNTDEWASRPTQFDPVPVMTADDPAPLTRQSVNPTLTVSARTRTGYNDDGAPLFTWTEVLTGEAILFEQRTEYDPDAGLTRVVGTATLLYEGAEKVVETAMVTDPAGGRWRVTAVSQTPGHLMLTLARLVST